MLSLGYWYVLTSHILCWCTSLSLSNFDGGLAIFVDKRGPWYMIYIIYLFEWTPHLRVYQTSYFNFAFNRYYITCHLAVFWVRTNEKHLVEPTANTVDVGDSIVGRTIVGGKLIGGRIVNLGIHRFYLFLGTLDGVIYRSSRHFEVPQISHAHKSLTPFYISIVFCALQQSTITAHIPM